MCIRDSNPCYYGDFLGDYREEVIMGSSDMKSIYIFSTNHPTEFRLPHLMTDHNYDMSQAMQNMGYILLFSNLFNNIFCILKHMPFIIIL